MNIGWLKITELLRVARIRQLVHICISNNKLVIPFEKSLEYSNRN